MTAGIHQSSTKQFAATVIPNGRITVEFRYDTREPYAVTAEFKVGRVSVLWMFARDLLQSGMVADSGEGDVQIEPDPAYSTVLIHLEPPSGRATIELDMQELGMWVDEIYALVPAGWETLYFDVDALIDELSGGVGD